MTKDKALEELFLAQRPHFDDHEAFMADLTRRLDAVEFVRRHQEETLLHYKIAMIAVFVIGIVSGVITMTFILSTPIEIPQFTIGFRSGLLIWLEENFQFFSTIAVALLMTLGLMSIIANTHDIIQMYKKRAALSF